jgi:hypothetical protein
MARNVFLISLLLFMSCKNEKPKQAFRAPDINDINEIVKTIIATDSLSFRANSPLSANLTKITIVPKNTDTIPPSIGTGNLPVTSLLDAYSNKYFSKNDSAYIFFQNKMLRSFRLDSTFSKLINLTDSNHVIKNRTKQSVFFSYYEMSIPIFSMDGKIAYVSIDYYCPLCGYGMAIVLKKINGNWKIITQITTWTN